ncbi:AAA family ATPase [Kribbella kalugense]|uniref:Transcriptional regulator n=1 Tax=Kribbella kalugense TaxID=2512221 RepID=A0A4R7ZXR9_9ACTN|nr:AAA family ATPase [Kribbella kalugense]TDW21961.1 transcriptional regulator [Kribbella kalugense]
MAIGLIGRDSELKWLSDLLDAPPATSQVQVLLGEPGLGKTVLLTELTRQAASQGRRVLSVAGRVSERDLAFAGLHQLLRPVLERVPTLPDRQSQALLSAFGLTDDPVPPDALLIGIAVLTLLSAVASDAPLLVVVDDSQWLDRASLDSLAFAARRLDTEPLVLVLAARGVTAPPGIDFPELVLKPLSTPEAGLLLDDQPDPPRGRAREQVLLQARGNPLALIELSKAIAADPSAGRRWTAEPLPLTERLTSVLATQYGVLPASARAALLLVAVADSPDVAARLPGLTLGPAEQAGLIRLSESGPQFAHPLVRAAIYHAVPFAERAAAHLAVAEILHDQPDRYGWHLAAAALEPDEKLAVLLEDTAMQAQRRGGAAAAARALERAAELSPAEDDQARRLLAAAGLALAAGQADWVQDLARRVLAVTADPHLRVAAQQRIGWALVWSNQHAAALTTLLAVVEEASPELPIVAWDAIGLAATVAYQSGAPADRAAVVRAIDRLPEPAQPTADWPDGLADEERIWVRACTNPVAGHADGVELLQRIVTRPVTDLAKVGAAAWLLDETELAVRLLREAVDRQRAPGTVGRAAAALSALQWACIDTGRWDEALAAAREAADAAAAYRMELVAATADLCVASVNALRGEHVSSLLASAAAYADWREYRSVAARAHHAEGMAAFAQGNVQAAYAQLRQLFDEAGTPIHHHVSYLAVADLAAAAVRTEDRLEARTLLEPALMTIEETSGPRLQQLAARARALLAEPVDAESYFEKALADPAGEQWPFERALLRLDYGGWLRRQRRINDAKPILAAALDTFRRLGTTPWTKRAESELRASGVLDAPTAPNALAELTAQQREIILLAARGLTNAEIGDRLFLSPRTVASHLYRAYPKLGIAGRHQLHDLL